MVRNIDVRSYGTDVEPLTLLLTGACAALLLFGRRDHAVLSLLLVATFISSVQRVVVGGLDFTMIRVLILVGWIRVFAREKPQIHKLTPVDIAFLVWLAIGTTLQPIRMGSMSTLVFRLGVAFDAIGIYFLIRLLVNTPRDVERLALQFLYVSFPIAAGMLWESLTEENLFMGFGAEPQERVRGDRIRAHGAFSHPIMAGSFGAGVLPIAIAFYMVDRRRRKLAVATAVSALVIVITSASSGPLASAVFALAVWGLWPVRPYLKQILLVGCAGLLALWVVWKPPWYLIGIAADVLGGTGWHRVRIINLAFENFDQWWLLGTSGTKVAHWGWGMQDLTNAYVVQGTRAGITHLIAFNWMLFAGFQVLGRRLRWTRQVRRRATDRGERQMARRQALFAWGLGAALASHCFSFIGVLYFGQMLILFYLQLALIASYAPVPVRARVRSASEAPAARLPAAEGGRPTR